MQKAPIIGLIRVVLQRRAKLFEAYLNELSDDRHITSLLVMVSKVFTDRPRARWNINWPAAVEALP